MIWDTAWLFLTIFVICSQSGDVDGLRNGNIISVILMTGVWLVFLTAQISSGKPLDQRRHYCNNNRNMDRLFQ